MHLNIFIVIFLTLFTGGHSLKCYDCTSTTDSCSTKRTCSTNYTTCDSATVVTTMGGKTATKKNKGCSLPQNCGNGSVNFGVLRLAMSMQCCNTDLCNTQDVPDYKTNANGKQCYSCDERSCFNTLNCIGTEDNCITAKANITSLPETLKGCASKFICDEASQNTGFLQSYTCCQGKLCNSAKSITQSLVLTLPFFFYILFQ